MAHLTSVLPQPPETPLRLRVGERYCSTQVIGWPTPDSAQHAKQAHGRRDAPWQHRRLSKTARELPHGGRLITEIRQKQPSLATHPPGPGQPMGARWSSSARHDQERSTAADYADYWSPTICFLSQPRQFQHWRCDPHTRTPLFTNHKCVGRVQHRGAHEAPARTTIKLEYRKLSDEVVLEWTHPSNAHLENPAEFTIVLSCCVCCGPAKVGDVQAQDLTPKGLPALLSRVQHEHGFWVHCPMRQRTFYFYGKNSEEQKEWVLLIRHNLEALRARPNADAFVMLKCKQTLGQHGYSKDEQGRRLNKVKQALRDRRFRQIDQKSDHLEDRIGWAIYQGRAGKLAALMGHQPSSRGAIQYIQENGWPVDKTFSEDLGGNSLLIEVGATVQHSSESNLLSRSS